MSGWPGTFGRSLDAEGRRGRRLHLARKAQAGTSRAPRTGREGRAREPRKGLRGERCSRPGRRWHLPAQGPEPPQVSAPLSPPRMLRRRKGRGHCQGSESAGTDCWGSQLQMPGDPGSCVTAPPPAPGWKNGQGRQAAAPSPATSLGPPAAGGQGRSHGCLVASGTRKEAQVSLAR